MSLADRVAQLKAHYQIDITPPPSTPHEHAKSLFIPNQRLLEKPYLERLKRNAFAVSGVARILTEVRDRYWQMGDITPIDGGLFLSAEYSGIHGTVLERVDTGRTWTRVGPVKSKWDDWARGGGSYDEHQIIRIPVYEYRWTHMAVNDTIRRETVIAQTAVVEGQVMLGIAINYLPPEKRDSIDPLTAKEPLEPLVEITKASNLNIPRIQQASDRHFRTYGTEPWQPQPESFGSYPFVSVYGPNTTSRFWLVTSPLADDAAFLDFFANYALQFDSISLSTRAQTAQDLAAKFKSYKMITLDEFKKMGGGFVEESKPKYSLNYLTPEN